MGDVIRPTHGRSGTPANKGKTYPVEILTPDEIRDLARQCSLTTSLGLRHRALIVLLYCTGLRIGEALALYPKDVDLEIGAVVVLHGRGNRMRTVGIDPGANSHIQAWLDRSETLGLSGAHVRRVRPRLGAATDAGGRRERP